MSDQSVPTEDFLRAEEAAQQLVRSLKRLDAEADSYSTAGKTLEQVSTEVRELASRTSVVAERSAEAVEAIRSIGSVQILEQVNKLSAGAEATATSVDGIGARLDALASQVDLVMPILNSIESKFDAVSVAVEESTKRTETSVMRAADAARADSEAVAKLAKNAMYAAVFAAVLAALAALLTRV